MTNKSETIARGGLLDLTGAAAAWLCAAHCLLLPLAVGILPLIGLGFLLDETVELAIIVVSCLIGAASLLPGLRIHRNARPIALFASGIALIVASHVFLEELAAARAVSLIAGAVLITSGHLFNRRITKICPVCVPENKACGAKLRGRD